ncbi:MAG: NADH-quinone oxidoreductase subunit C [Candidatus Baldrarchaeia archaeon]
MKEEVEKELVEAIKSKFPDVIEEAEVLRSKRISVTVKVDKILEVARFIRDELGFDYPISAGAVDYIKEKQFQVIYYLLSSKKKVVLMLRVNIPRDRPIAPSLTPVWSAMDFHERETWEMFGITFKGHPNLTRLLLPEDWEGGYPLRKDFKLSSKEGS